MFQMIKQTLECRKIELYCDIHGHSTQKNLFVYGNNEMQTYLSNCNGTQKNKVPEKISNTHKEKIFPQ